MSFWWDNNIKNTAKEFVIKNKEYIEKKLKENGNNPQTLEEIKSEFIALVSKDILDSYQKGINDRNERIKELEKEIKKFYDDLTTQITAERSIYWNEVMWGIKKYFELLQEEEKSYNENEAKLKWISEKVDYINKLLSDNEGQITNSLNHIKDLEKRYKTYINQNLDKAIEKLNHITDDEKKRIVKKLQDNYDKYLKDLKNNFERLNQELEKDYENTKKKVEKDLSKAFSIEEMWLKKEKKEMLKELLYFDGYTFLKVFLILWFTLWIIFLDYSLMRDIIAQYFEIDPYSDTPFKLFLYQYIVPFIFSGWIILSEIINDKVVKYHSKTTYWVLKIFAYIAILWVIGSVVLTSEGIVFEITQLPEVIIRLILFGMSIPAAVILVDRFITLHDILDFVKMTILLPIKIVLVPFVYIMYFFENIRLRKYKKNAIEQVQNVNAKLSLNLNTEPLKVELWDLVKIESFKEKDYNILFHDDLDNNFKHILHSLNQIRNTISDLNILINKWDEIIKEKLKIIMNLLTEVDTRLDKKIKNFEKQYLPYIESLKKEIKEIQKDIEKDEETYLSLKQQISEWVLEWISESI